MKDIITPGGKFPLHPQAERLVGRSYDELTYTEAKIHDHLSLQGELYWGKYDSSTGLVTTDLGRPGTEITIRVRPRTLPADAARELASVADYLVNNFTEETQ
jgi:hypothetical protein